MIIGFMFLPKSNFFSIEQYPICKTINPEGLFLTPSGQICQEFTAESNYISSIQFDLYATNINSGSGDFRNLCPQEPHVPFIGIYGIKTSPNAGNFISIYQTKTYTDEPKIAEVNFTAIPGQKYWACLITIEPNKCLFLDGYGDSYPNHQSAVPYWGTSSLDIDLIIKCNLSSSCIENVDCSSWGTCHCETGPPCTQVRTCIPTDCPEVQTCIPSCNTIADTDCNGIVDRTELGSAINNWIVETISRSELAQAIAAWSGA